MSTNNSEIKTFNVITLGESSVGKTSIFTRFTSNTFEATGGGATIGVSFLFKDIILKSNTTIKLKLIDTAGEERYRSIAKSYYKNAQGVLFIFDLSNLNTFNCIEKWIESFKENTNSPINIPKYLVGNKSDLEHKVPQESIDELVKKADLKYLATSAKDGSNIQELFKTLSEEMYDSNKKVPNVQNKIKLSKLKEEPKESNCICSL